MEEKKNPDNIECTPEKDAVQDGSKPVSSDDAVASVQAELDAARKEAAETKDRYLHMAAEYDNYRKRSQRERDALYADALASAVSAILPVLDNLERAVEQPTEDDNFKKGVEMTLTQMYECFDKLGVHEIPALGEQFDPMLHNAVMHVDQENCDDNTIVEVFQKGFTIGDRVVRYSTVKVAN